MFELKFKAGPLHEDFIYQATFHMLTKYDQSAEPDLRLWSDVFCVTAYMKFLHSSRQVLCYGKYPYIPRAEVCVSVNNDVWSEGPPQYQKQQGRLLNRRELQGLFVSHRIKLAWSISFSVTQRHYGLLVKPNTQTLCVKFCFSHFLFFTYLYFIDHRKR